MIEFLPNEANQAFELTGGDPTVEQTLTALLYSVERLTKYEWVALFEFLCKYYGLSAKKFSEIFLNGMPVDQNYSVLLNTINYRILHKNIFADSVE